MKRKHYRKRHYKRQFFIKLNIFAEGFRSNLMGKKKEDVVNLQIKTAFEDKEAETTSDLGLSKKMLKSILIY